jgi:hypothetical protein
VLRGCGAGHRPSDTSLVAYRHVTPRRGTLTYVTNPGQTFTVTTAAEACQVSRKTITRRIDQLKDGGAYKDATGAWVIPLGALLHAGLSPGRPAAPDPVQLTQGGDVGRQDTGPDRETQAQLADLQRRAEVAEALAAERAEQISDLRRTLAMLTAGQSAPPPASTPVPESSVPASVPRRGPLERLVGRFGL